MADAWSLFGTTLTLQEFLGFLRLEEHQRIVKRVGFWGLVTTIVRAAPITARIALRGYRMSVAWPWASFDSQLERLLTDIRREFNIKVLYVP